MITERLNDLKAKGNFSWQELSDMTGIPVPTIRKTFSGETVNPSFEVVYKLITAMGGTISGPDEPNGEPTLQTERDDDMQAIIEQLHKLYEERISDLWRIIDRSTAERKILFITLITLVGLLVTFIVYLFVDGMHGNWGFFRY